jgi:hypothetical protein
VTLDVHKLERVASARVSLLVEGPDRCPLGDWVCVVVDASCRSGSDILAWNVAVDDGISLEEERLKIEVMNAEQGVGHRPFIVAQLFPLALIPRMLGAIGLGKESSRMCHWLADPIPSLNVRVLLIAGSDLAFKTMPIS